MSQESDRGGYLKALFLLAVLGVCCAVLATCDAGGRGQNPPIRQHQEAIKEALEAIKPIARKRPASSSISISNP